MVNKSTIASVEISVPIVNDYTLYDFKIEGRIGFFVQAVVSALRHIGVPALRYGRRPCADPLVDEAGGNEVNRLTFATPTYTMAYKFATFDGLIRLANARGGPLTLATLEKAR